MVRPVDSSNIPHPASRPAASQPTQDVSKSSESVGHRAKAEIAIAAAEGQDLPKNIQGKVASALARGLSLDSILNLQDASAPIDDTVPVVDDPVAGDPVTGDPVVDDPVAGDPVVDDPVAGDPVAGDPVAGDPVVDDPVVDQPVGDVVIDDPVIEEPVGDPVVDDPVAEVVADELLTELPDPETAVLGSVLDDLVTDSDEAETV